MTADLWDALEEVSGQPVRAMMDTWILQGGHPLVSRGRATSLTQQPVLLRPPGGRQPSAIGSRWQVPVLAAPARRRRRTTTRLLLGAEPVAVAGHRDPMVVNAGGWGVYRVGLRADHLAALGRRPRRARPRSSGRTCSPTPGRWCWPATGRPRRLPRAGRRPRRRGRARDLPR